MTTLTAKVLSPLDAWPDAWTRVTSISKTSREDWRIIGEALRIGRRLHASNKAFGAWCRKQGFSAIDRRLWADAMWLAANWEATQKRSLSSSLNHPQVVRAAYRTSLRLEIVASIEAGRAAWAEEKLAADVSRERWRLIGEALLVGSQCACGKQLFSHWCRNEGFADIPPRVRHHAMWLAEAWSDVEALDIKENHPTAIFATYDVLEARRDRERFRETGEALLIGRRLHASDMAFDEWCHESGFSCFSQAFRDDAMWLAENWSVVQAMGNDIAHPTSIRIAYNASVAPSL